MRYLIDTNTLSLAMRKQGKAEENLLRHARADLLLSSIVLGEGRAGAYRTARTDHWLTFWDTLTDGWEAVPFDHDCADHYGRIRADLERRGKMIGHRDCQIAASALAYAKRHGVAVTVVTDNTDEFHRVPGLKVANWAR